MTVDLDRHEVQSILSLYHIDDLTDFGLVRTELFSTTYWVKALDKKYFLRVSLRRRFADMVFEKDLLVYLRATELPVPRLVENVASGAFTPWSSRGRYISLFEFVEGRALGQFQLEPEHTSQIGDFLGHLHCLGEDFSSRKAKRDLLLEFSEDLDRLQRSLDAGRFKTELVRDLSTLRDEFSAQKSRSMSGSSGLHHGRLILTAAHFHREQLVLVRDFSSARHDRFTLDLAIAINAWCWDASARQRGGPSGLYSPARLRALLSAYSIWRPLSPRDYLDLADDLRLSVAQIAVHRIKNYELRGRSDELFEDYRHYTARLDALAETRANELLKSVGAFEEGSQSKAPRA